MGRRPAVRRKPLNPGAGPGRWPVLMPEAFGGNRRLYTGSAPAADRRRVDPVSTPCRPRVDPVSTLARRLPDVYPVIYNVFCVQGSKTSFFTVFRALRRPRILSWRCSKTVVFTWFWAPGRGKNRRSWHLEGVST